MPFHRTAFAVILRALAATLLIMACASPAPSAEGKPPEIELPSPLKHPIVACTADELQRLRAAWKSGSKAENAVIAEVVGSADRALERPIEFPPRGGQHNQWYQCDKCQLGLRTLDATHHQCPKCKTVYSGEPYDDVLFSRVHGRNLSNMESAAWAYAITQERKYAEFAARVLLGYAQRYEKYPYHSSDPKAKPGRSAGHIAEQTLNEAGMMAREIAPAYDLIYDSGALSPADHEAIRSGLLLPMLRNMDKNKTGKSNWQSWHNAAMLMGGAALGDVEWVRKSIADPQNGFLFQMGESVTGDGMWYENSWGYHSYTLSALVAQVEGARRLGLDLWSHPALRKMFLVPVQYAMPDGSLPRFGDDVESTVGSAARHLEFAWHAYRDPAILPYLSEAPSWNSILLGRRVAPRPPKPSLGSMVFHSAGHAILRTSGESGLASAFTFGPYGGFHGHFDKLSFVFFGYGSELGVDPGRARSQAYRLPIHGNWYKATLGHNTVLVDRKSQAPASGRLLCFAANERYAAAVAECTEAYRGIRHRRALCQTPDYLLVFDDLAGAGEHTFDWVYHNHGDAAACDAAAKVVELDRLFLGGEYIDNARTGETREPVRVKFAGEKTTTYVLLDGAPGTEILTGDGPGGSVLDRVPLMMATRRGPSARFAAVIAPIRGAAPPGISRVNWESRDGAAHITVARGGSSDRFVIGSRGEVAVSVDNQNVLSGQPQSVE